MSTDPNITNPNAQSPVRGLEHLLKRIARYPLATLQVVLFMLVAWGIVGGELGASDLFWHENWVQQFFVGSVVCLLFGTVLFVTVLLLPPRAMPGAPLDKKTHFFDDVAVSSASGWFQWLGEWLLLLPVWRRLRRWCPTLLPSRDPGVRHVGAALISMLVVLLFVLYIGKQIAIIAGVGIDSTRKAEALKAAREVFGDQRYGLPFLGGYFCALVFGFVVGCADAAFQWRERLARLDWFRRGFDHPSVLIRFP